MLEAMRLAYARAGAEPMETNLLFAHGTGTPLNDLAETKAVRDWFGQHVANVAVTALKSLVGHTSGASGLMSLVTAVLAIERGQVPPIAGLENPLPEAAGFDFVRTEPRTLPARTVQIDAFGFGGVNAVALIEEFD